MKLTANQRLELAKQTKSQEVIRYTTMMPAIDAIFEQNGKRGIPAGMYIFAGDPGTGKSTLLIQMLVGFAIKGHTTAYFAFEGKASNVYPIVQRLKLRDGALAPYIPAFLDETDDVPPKSDALIAFLQELSDSNKTGKPIVVAIDALKHINGSDGHKGRKEAITALFQWHKRLCEQGKGMIIFLIGHIDKTTRGKGKQKKLQGVAEAEELADCTLYLNDVTVNADPSKPREVMLSTTKNRWGSVGEFTGFTLTAKGYVF